MTLFNVDNKFNNFDFTQEFTLQIGVKVGAAFQYVTVGVFKGERPDKVRGKLMTVCRSLKFLLRISSKT